MLVRLDPNPPAHISRYRWVVLAVTFLNQGIVVGNWYIFSVILKPVDAEFGWGRGPLSLSFSLMVIVQATAGPFVGGLVDRFGPRVVIPVGLVVACLGGVLSTRVDSIWLFALTFGLLMGLGVGGAGWIPNGVLLARWFPDRLGTAIGLSSAGVGVGLFALVPLAQYVTTEFDWRTAVLVQSALLLPLAAVNLFLQRPIPALSPAGRGSVVSPASKPREGPPDWTLRRALASAPFWWLALAFYCNEFTQQLLSVHHIAYLTDAGRPPFEAALAAGLLGAVAFPGKMFWGFFADRYGRALAFSLGTGFLLVAVPLLALAGSTAGWFTLWTYGFVVGMGFATIGPLAAPMAADLYRGRAFGAIFGAVTVSTGFGSASGVTLAGVIFDTTGSYFGALVLAVGACMLSIIGALLALRGVGRGGSAASLPRAGASAAPIGDG